MFRSPPLIACLVAIALLLAGAPRGAATGYLSPDWVRTFGGAGRDEGWGVEVGPDGETYLIGFVQGQGNDMFLARIESSGTVAWEQTILRPYQQKGFEVVHDGDFLYAGGVTARDLRVESQDMFLVKLWASNGTFIWATSWNGPADLYDEADGLIVEDGYVYASGWADVSTDYTSGSVALVKFDAADGLTIQDATWGGMGRDGADGSMASDGTNLYISGIRGGVNLVTGGDVLVAAFNQTSLTEVWNASWGGAAYDDGLGLTIHEGDLYVTGLTLSSGDDGILLLKYDLEGNRIWNTTWGGSGSESARSVEVSANGSAVFVAGQTSSYGNGSTDIVVLEFTPEGGFVNYRTWGAAGSDVSQGLAICGDAVCIAGNKGVQGLNTDAFAMRVGPGNATSGPGENRPPSNLGLLALAIVGLGALVLVLFIVMAVATRRRRRP